MAYEGRPAHHSPSHKSPNASASDGTRPWTPNPVAVVVGPHILAVADEPESDTGACVSRAIHGIAVGQKQWPQSAAKGGGKPARSNSTHPVLTPIEAPMPSKTINCTAGEMKHGISLRACASHHGHSPWRKPLFPREEAGFLCHSGQRRRRSRRHWQLPPTEAPSWPEAMAEER